MAAIFGALPIAVLVAAFAVPIVYIVYLYDVNLWEDEPVLVTGLAFVVDRSPGADLHHRLDGTVARDVPGRHVWTAPWPTVHGSGAFC